MLGWIAAAAYLAFAIYLYRKKRQEDQEEFYEVNAVQLREEIAALSRCMKELESLDSLLIDVRLCKPEEAQRVFRMEWQSVSGTNHSFDFFLDGQNQSSAYMMELAEAEREALNQEILRRVFDLYRTAVLLTGEGETP